MRVTHLTQCLAYGKNSISSYKIIMDEWNLGMLSNYLFITNKNIHYLM